MSAAAGFAFSPAHRMVDRVHGYAAVVRFLAQITFLAGFAELDVHVFNIADLADSGAAFDMNLPDFAARQLDLSIFAFFSAESGDLSGRSDQPGAASRNHLDIMDFQADGNILDFQAVAGFQFGFFTVHDGVADLEAVRCDNVLLFAVSIEQQGDISRAVRIVFERADGCLDSIFAALEVNQPEQALGAAAAETAGDATPIISTAGSSLADGKILFRADF